MHRRDLLFERTVGVSSSSSSSPSLLLPLLLPPSSSFFTLLFSTHKSYRHLLSKIIFPFLLAALAFIKESCKACFRTSKDSWHRRFESQISYSMLVFAGHHGQWIMSPNLPWWFGCVGLTPSHVAAAALGWVNTKEWKFKHKSFLRYPQWSHVPPELHVRRQTSQMEKPRHAKMNHVFLARNLGPGMCLHGWRHDAEAVRQSLDGDVALICFKETTCVHALLQTRLKAYHLLGISCVFGIPTWTKAANALFECLISKKKDLDSKSKPKVIQLEILPPSSVGPADFVKRNSARSFHCCISHWLDGPLRQIQTSNVPPAPSS